MEIKGTVVQNLGVESGTSKSGKDWSKASVVIETGGQYPKKVFLTSFKDAEKFGALRIGDKAEFHVEVESKEWTNSRTGKTSWITEVRCWKWNVEPGAVAESQPQVQSQQSEDPFASAKTMGGDDLPF